jgi:hypothetical protein
VPDAEVGRVKRSHGLGPRNGPMTARLHSLGLQAVIKKPPLTACRHNGSHFSFGSDAEYPSMSAARLLHPAQRTNAAASLNVCVGPKPDVKWACVQRQRNEFTVRELLRFSARANGRSSTFRAGSRSACADGNRGRECDPPSRQRTLGSAASRHRCLGSLEDPVRSFRAVFASRVRRRWPGSGTSLSHCRGRSKLETALPHRT